MSSDILPRDEDSLFREAHPPPIREAHIKCGVQTLSPHSAQLTTAEGELTYSDRMKRNDTRHVDRDDSKAPVTQGLRPGYDLATTEFFRNRGQIVERTHDWSRRSWMIARAKSVAARSWSCSKLLKPQSHGIYDQVTN